MDASNEVVWIVMNMLLSLRCGWDVSMGVVTACLLLVRGGAGLAR